MRKRAQDTPASNCSSTAPARSPRPALAIILIAKFIEGAWITIVTIPALMILFWLVHRHYRIIATQVVCHQPLDITHEEPPIVLVPVRGWDWPTSKSLRFGMHLSDDVIAIHLGNLEGDEAKQAEAKLRKEWAQRVESPAHAAGAPVPKLLIVQTPYREFIHPLLEEIDKIKAQSPQRPVVVIIPEVVEKHWWQAVLHSRRASRLRSALRKREDARVVVIDIPWFVQD